MRKLFYDFIKKLCVHFYKNEKKGELFTGFFPTILYKIIRWLIYKNFTFVACSENKLFLNTITMLFNQN